MLARELDVDYDTVDLVANEANDTGSRHRPTDATRAGGADPAQLQRGDVGSEEDRYRIWR